MIFLFVLFLFGSVATAHAATVIVTVDGIESNRGEVNVGLCNKGLSSDGCPFNAEQPAVAGMMEFKFENVPPGRYAVASYHDVNANEEFDRFLGMPREPYALSNDGGDTLIPDFEGAAFQVREGETKVTVRMRRFMGR